MKVTFALICLLGYIVSSKSILFVFITLLIVNFLIEFCKCRSHRHTSLMFDSIFSQIMLTAWSIIGTMKSQRELTTMQLVNQTTKMSLDILHSNTFF